MKKTKPRFIPYFEDYCFMHFRSRMFMSHADETWVLEGPEQDGTTGRVDEYLHRRYETASWVFIARCIYAV